MKIAVIAANGRTGKEFVKYALSQGHTIRAGIHRHNTLSSHPNLLILPCDVNDIAHIERLIAGCDAVVSLIGHVNGSQADIQTRGIHNIIAVMKKHRMRRILSLTGSGVRFKFDRITPMDRILNLSISILDPQRVKDGNNHAEVLKSTDLDWTILRVLKLQNTRPNLFQLTENGPTKTFVSRKEVAHALLQILELGTFNHRAPMISYISRRP